MKKIFKLTTLVLGIATLFSCQGKNNTEPDKPSVLDITFNTLKNGGVTASGDLNIFLVEAGSADGAALSVEFIGNRSFLSAGTYKPGDGAALTYRNARFSNSQVKGAVKEGELTVSAENSQYSISGVLKLEDDTILKVTASGELVYAHEKPAAQHLYTADVVKDENGLCTWTVSVYTLDEQLEASFAFLNGSESSFGGSYEVSGLEGLASGKAMAGYDLSIIGLGKGGCYYFTGGAIRFIQEGSGVITVTEEDGQINITAGDIYVVDGNNAPIEAENGKDVSWLFCEEGEITPAGPEYEPLIIAGGKYTDTVVPKDACDEHTILVKDADGNIVGQVVLRTGKDAESLGGEYAFSAEEVAGSLSGGLDLSAMGLGVLGSYYVKDGKIFTLTAGNATVQDGETLSIVLSDVVSIYGEEAGTASPVSFLMLTKEESDPAADPTDGIFTYSHTSDAKEGYSEHTFTVFFSNGNTFLNLLVGVADDAAAAGDNIFSPAVYPVATSEEWNAGPAGKACPGFNFFGMADLGCYYYVNGAINYLTEGTVKLVENADGLVVSIVGTDGNAIPDAPASLALLSATKVAE